MATDDDNGNYGGPIFHGLGDVTLKATPGETMLMIQLTHDGTLEMYTCAGCLATAERLAEQLHRLADELLDKHEAWVTVTEEPT